VIADRTAVVRSLLAAMLLLLAMPVGGHAQPVADTDPQPDDPTPARLSYTVGSVSFWRPGGIDWAPAQVNTPLAAGDELYTARDGNLEVQVSGQAFVRAWGDTQLGVVHQDPGYVQLRVSAGHVALDFRALDPGEVVEVATPAAAFTIEQPGYYRVDVTTQRTTFVTRRSGQAAIATASGPAGVVAPGEAVVLEGDDPSQLRRMAAAEPDVWDRWNEARTAALVASGSARYVAPQVYGVNELDRYGTWHTEPTYGAVWVPAGVPVGWAPYSTGRWIWDPRFGWTWVDTAIWGWAPYHYGRWVHVRGVWAWAPGPIVVRPVYAPALVAFFGAPGVSVTVSGPSVGWVALGWGEPVVPWWGRSGFVGRPWWGGWGGPRVTHVTVHRNVSVVNAVVVVRSEHFGRRAVHEARVARPDVKRLEPVRGRLAVAPDAASFTPSSGRATRPPEAQVARPVVATRPPARRPDPPRATDEPRGDAARSDGRRDRSGVRGDVRPDVRPGERLEPRIERRQDAAPDGPRDRARDARPAAPRPDGAGEPRPAPRTPGDPAASKATPAPSAPKPAPPASTTPPAAVTPPPAVPRAPSAPGASAPRAPEPPRSDVRRPEPPARRAEPPRVDSPRPEPPRPQGPPPDVERREPRRPETSPRSEAPARERGRREPARAEPSRAEPPRRAGAPGPETLRRPEPARAVSPERGPAPVTPRTPPRERNRQER
jgi:hypothetical protein